MRKQTHKQTPQAALERRPRRLEIAASVIRHSATAATARLFVMSLLVLVRTPAHAALPQDATGSVPEKPVRVTTETDPVHQEQHIRVEEGTCRIEWTVYQSDVNKGVVRHRATCDLPLERQIPLLTPILLKVLETENRTAPFRTLSWGRLSPDVKQDQLEMSIRLAVAAHLSPDWDREKGMPKQGHENAFLVRLANQAMIYRELERLFARFNRKLVFSSAEKVLIAEAGTLPFFDQLSKMGVQPTEKLPFDCQTWFSVSEQTGPK